MFKLLQRALCAGLVCSAGAQTQNLSQGPHRMEIVVERRR